MKSYYSLNKQRSYLNIRKLINYSFSSLRDNLQYNSLILYGSCDCGKVSYEAKGLPYLNFYSHSNAPREASNDNFLIGSAFKSNQVEFKGNVIDSSKEKEYMPKNSSNPHFFCSCQKKQYLGVDATRLLGFLVINLRKASGYKENTLPDIYRPNHHLFYSDRVVNCPDNLPKWKTVLQGEIYKENETIQQNNINNNNSNDNLPQVNLDDLKLSLYNCNTVKNCDLNYNRPIFYTNNGNIIKDVLPLSPVRAPEPLIYHFHESDPPVNNITKIPQEKIVERVKWKYHQSPGVYIAPTKVKRDVIVIGGGHNGLITSAYLARQGLDTLVLERRHIVGGAAVTEEIIPGYKFSRASYLAGLLRPNIIKDLELEKYGFKYLPRNPSSFTPTLESSPYKGKYLLLGENENENYQSIAQFSIRDADAYPKYEEFLGKVREIITPLLDNPLPFNPFDSSISWKNRIQSISTLSKMISVGYHNKEVIVPFYELFTGPAQLLLDRWFESEILKTTLATDAVVGALVSLKQNGSAYVLLHHVMGEAAGKKGVWSYVEGGMGSISNAIAKSSQEYGTEIIVNAPVSKILWKDNKVIGVEMSDGSKIYSDIVVSGCTPYHTFMELLPGLSKQSGYNQSEQTPIPLDYIKHLRFTDYSCGALKINCAVNKLPNFLCYPTPNNGLIPGPMHKGTVHFECTMEEIENCYREASMGIPATRPVIEMTIPSSIDKTLAPNNHHIVQLFIQFVPYDIDPKIGNWADERFKNQYVNHILSIIDQYCPGFSHSIIGMDVLTPLDLEKVFGLHKGQICHGSLTLNQLGYSRPMAGYSHHQTPLKGLYLGSAGTHPGGGVMGAPGKNCADVIIRDLQKK